jgi:hypothetical protein
MKAMLKAAPLVALVFILACSTAYKAQPLPFKTPAAYQNAVNVDGVQVAGQAFTDPRTAKKAFGFDIRGAGMLPVQLVFDNQGQDSLEINPGQTFLEDDQGNLWPILSDNFAHQRATKYAQTNEIFKKGAYTGFLGAAAGSLVGAAIGIVSGQNVGSALGKGAAVGAAAGATLGGAAGAYGSKEARSSIVNDLQNKSLKNKPIEPGELSHGILFFPGEAKSAKQLRLQLKDLKTNKVYTVTLHFK